jgi:Multicopper oxidase
MAMVPGSQRIESWLHRRNFLIGAGASGMALGTALGTAYTQIAATADYSLQIGPLRLELAPGKVIETFGYNGIVPGPLLRLREGRQISIDTRNNTDIDDIVHWHGLYVWPASANVTFSVGLALSSRNNTRCPSRTRTGSPWPSILSLKDADAYSTSRPLSGGGPRRDEPAGRLDPRRDQG